MTDEEVRLEGRGQAWRIVGTSGSGLDLVNGFLDYLAALNYSPLTIRSYGFDLLSFVRWLKAGKLDLLEVRSQDLLGFISDCRFGPAPGRPPMGAGACRVVAPSTINRRMAAISAMYSFAAMRDPSIANPVPRPRERRTVGGVSRTGLLGHLAKPAPLSPLRLRTPRRLPRALDRDEIEALLGSLRSWRDRAIAGLMLYSGLRSAEVLGLEVKDVDIGARWMRVVGKGDKERRIPIDVDVAGVVQVYLLTERPETDATKLFVVLKGPHRGQPLTAAGLRTIFRHHRAKSGVTAGHPHALRHSFGTALAEAGVDLAVMQALLGHDNVDSTAAYIHLAPVHLRREFDAARARQRARQ